MSLLINFIKISNDCKGFLDGNVVHTAYKYDYRYFVKGSLNYRFQEFFYDEESEEAVMAKRRLDEIILYYECEEERKAFGIYAYYQKGVV